MIQVINSFMSIKNGRVICSRANTTNFIVYLQKHDSERIAEKLEIIPPQSIR